MSPHASGWTRLVPARPQPSRRTGTRTDDGNRRRGPRASSTLNTPYASAVTRDAAPTVPARAVTADSRADGSGRRGGSSQFFAEGITEKSRCAAQATEAMKVVEHGGHAVEHDP